MNQKALEDLSYQDDGLVNVISGLFMKRLVWRLHSEKGLPFRDPLSHLCQLGWNLSYGISWTLAASFLKSRKTRQK